MKMQAISSGLRGAQPAPLLTAATLFLLLAAAPPPSLSAGDPGPLEAIPLTGCLKVDSAECVEQVVRTPAPLAWEEAAKRASLGPRIDPPTAAELSYRDGSLFSKKETRTVDLSSQVPRWLALDFRKDGQGPPAPWMQTTGAILARFRDARGDPDAREALLRQLETEAPGVWEQVRDFLPEWVRDDYLYSAGWSPGKTGSAGGEENDGILERPPFLTPPAPDGAGGQRKIYQACAPVYASLEELFAAENDFQDYHEQAGANYLEVFPLEGTAFHGRDPGGAPFLLYDVAYHQRPLPLWNLRFGLRQFLHREGGRWQMENQLIESWQVENRRVKGDMAVLRLRIFYDPIQTPDGGVIGYVKTEWIDVDIDGLPDGDSDRQTGARGDVGNIKRMAEKRDDAARASR